MAVVDVAAEKRQTIRTVLHSRIVMTVSDETRVSGESVDIGEGGCCGRFQRQLRVGDKVRLATTLPTAHMPLPVEYEGSVAWCILSQGSYKIGFQFTSLKESQRAAIRRLCATGKA